MNRRDLMVGSTLGFGALCLPSSVSANLTPRAEWEWHTAAPMPAALQEIYPAVHHNTVMVAGGIGAKLGVPYFSSATLSYKPDSDSWLTLANLPLSLHHAALASTGDDLYLIGAFHGGYTHVWRMLAQIWQLTEQGWIEAGTLPAAQAEGVLTTHNGQIHLVTGQTPKGAANTARSDHHETVQHWVSPFPAQNNGAFSWQSAAPIPTARNSATGGWVNDQLVVTGGRNNQGNFDVTEVYDSKEDRWRTARPMPLPQAGTASAVSPQGELIVCGGEIFVPEAGVFANTWAYSLALDTWRPLADLPTPRHGLGAGVINNALYVVGGATKPSGRGTSAANECLKFV